MHLRKVEQENKYMKKSQVLTAITNRIKRDLVHNPLHLIFSLDVLSMTKSTLASLSKGFAELSIDGQFVQLRSQQVRYSVLLCQIGSVNSLLWICVEFRFNQVPVQLSVRSSFHLVGSMTLMKILGWVCVGNGVRLGIPIVYEVLWNEYKVF